ncbi:hypothetical protein [Vibrio furnissii]|uniref:hypothetical protein n=1 Tax=Vibrio furnissii TaxID=29494 RepID=UPI001EEA5DA0|nr:hypothetical protein [Vibrio furnissii]MCG6268571.1 hypothetical protein [Vibrio furnissii]HCE4999492.1 hypothetical protein [Vibrio parahaemolyticus]
MSETKQIVIAYTVSAIGILIIGVFCGMAFTKSQLSEDVIDTDVPIKELIDKSHLSTTSKIMDNHIFTLRNKSNEPIPYFKPVSQVDSVELNGQCGNTLEWFKRQYENRKVVKTVCLDGSEIDGIKPFECEKATVLMYYPEWKCNIYNDLVLTMPGIDALNITL